MTKKQFAKIKKPSRLLTVALADLLRAEKRRKTIIDMGCWVRRDLGGTCYSCLAGAVMLEIGLPRWRCSVNPFDYVDIDIRSRLHALNNLRCGEVSAALGVLGLLCKKDLDRDVTDYHVNRDQWFQDMRKLTADLRKEGL